MAQHGNSSSHGVLVTAGAANHRTDEREPNDFYATHYTAIDALRSVIDIPEVVFEPCCGAGDLSKRLEEFGHEVYSSDLIDRGYGSVQDFFEVDSLPMNCECILTNPPFKESTKVIKHALDLLPKGGKLFLLLRTLSLEGIDRHQMIYKDNPPRYVFPFTGRMICAKNGDFASVRGSAQSYSWFYWEKGYKGNPEIKWIEFNLKKKNNNGTTSDI